MRRGRASGKGKERKRDRKEKREEEEENVAVWNSPTRVFSEKGEVKKNWKTKRKTKWSQDEER